MNDRKLRFQENLRSVFILLILCNLPVTSTSQNDQTLYRNVNIVNGKNSLMIPNAALLVEDGLISRIFENAADAPSGIYEFDLKGKFVMPGLIDAHVHIRDLESARRALLSGVTTARSMGVDHFTDIGMRELGRNGGVDVPEIFAAGYHVRPEPASGFFMDFPSMVDLMGGKVKGVNAVQRMGHAMVVKGVDWIKVNATARAGLPQTDPREPYYDETEILALVETGAAAGIPVAAHAHGDQGGKAAVLGGVKSIEHGTYLSEETLSLMKEKGTFLVPTIAVVTDLTLPGGDYDIPLLEIRGRHMLPRVREMAAKAHRMGVTIVAATDTGYGPNSTLRLSEELNELVQIGMTNEEAIRAATVTGAQLLGIAERVGIIEEGKEADLLILDRNPLEDILAVRDPLMVINNGKVVLNRLKW